MKKLLSYVLLIFWMIIIYLLSNQTGSMSGSNSGKIIYNTLKCIYELFHINTDNLYNIVEFIHSPLRELMHMLEYLILSILIYYVLSNYNSDNKFIISVMFCFIYATFDEIHQIFIPNRTFEYFDIFMDIIGAIIGIFISSKKN